MPRGDTNCCNRTTKNLKFSNGKCFGINQQQRPVLKVHSVWLILAAADQVEMGEIQSTEVVQFDLIPVETSRMESQRTCSLDQVGKFKDVRTRIIKE